MDLTSNLPIILPIIIIEILLATYCIFQIVKNPVKYLPKWLWSILCLNIIGCIVFLILGRTDD